MVEESRLAEVSNTCFLEVMREHNIRRSIAAKHWREVKVGKETWVEVSLTYNREGEAEMLSKIGERLEAFSIERRDSPRIATSCGRPVNLGTTLR